MGWITRFLTRRAPRAEHEAFKAQVAAERAAPPPGGEANLDLSAAPSLLPPGPGNCGIDWGRYDEAGIDMMLLGLAYRWKNGRPNRRAEGTGLMPDGDDVLLGVPISEAQFAPRSHQTPGWSRALSNVIEPLDIAQKCILRDPDGTEYAGKSCHCMKSNRIEWREDERIAVGELELRLAVGCERFVDRGWIVARPPVPWNDKDDGRGPNGMIERCHFSPRVFAEAEKRVPGSEQARVGHSALADMPQSLILHAREHVPWLYREYVEGLSALD